MPSFFALLILLERGERYSIFLSGDSLYPRNRNNLSSNSHWSGIKLLGYATHETNASYLLSLRDNGENTNTNITNKTHAQDRELRESEPEIISSGLLRTIVRRN